MPDKTDVVLFGAIIPPLDFSITPGSFPLGIMAMAPILRQKGWATEIISGAFKDAPLRLEKALQNTRYFGVSSMTGPYLKMAVEISKAVKKKYPHIPIIWGGVHATLLPEETIKEDYVDIIVRGMGEETLWRLIEALDNKMPLADIQGITYKDNGRIVSNPDVAVQDITKFPSFDYNDFLPYKSEVSELPYISSRGCPYGCTFCVASKLYSHRYYFYPAERIFDEIRGLTSAFNCRRITFWDDNFFVSQERLRRFCRLIMENGLKIKWSAFCHCDLFLRYSDEDVKLMREAGLQNISFGAESGSQKILDLIKKKITNSQILFCVCRTLQFGIGADFTFMTGFPRESTEDFRLTIKLFKDMLKVNPDVSIRLFAFTPYPKIPILEQEPGLSSYFPDTIESWAALTYQNYTPRWLDKRRQGLIADTVWMVNFLSRKQSPKTKNKLLNFIFYFYHLSAVFRLKNNFLFLPIEWRFFKWVYKINSKMTAERISRWRL